VSDPADLLARELPDIFHDYSVTLAPDSLEIWTAVVGENAAQADVEGASFLVLAACGRGIPGGFRDSLVERLRERLDGAYPSEGREGELQALSAATLVRLLEDGVDATRATAALGLLAADFNGWSSPATVLPDLARRYVRRAGEQLRRRPDLPDTRAAATTSAISKLPSLKDVQWTAPHEAMPYVEGQSTAIRSIARTLEQLANAVDARQKAHDEEVDLLWWSTNERDQTGLEWSERDLGSRIAVAAHEAAERTAFIPGPPAIETLILRVLGEGAREIKLTEMVVEAAAGWRELGLQPSHQRTGLLPLVTAVSEAVELEGSDAWEEVVASKYGIRLSERDSVANVAAEFYRELLARRLLTSNTAT
jgi:hypothetical protein